MKTALICGIVALGIVGCSPESKQEYQSAGQNLGQAAKATGKAVATDAQVAAKATQNAAAAAKKTVDQNATEEPIQKTTQTTDANGNTVTTTTTKH